MQKQQLSELDALMTGFWLTDLANFSAFFYFGMAEINWIGFYLSDGEKLRLGPFMGKPACVEIAFNRGVCGAAFTRREIIVVDDVHQFPGHIACDVASQSELVLPFEVGGKLLGVLDIDSPKIGRFSPSDVVVFVEALEILCKRCEGFAGLSPR